MRVIMNTESFANSKVVHFIFRIIGAVMESRLRYKYLSPKKIIKGAKIKPGQTVLEVGSGTGFYTVTAAEFIGDRGCLVSMDILPLAVKRVSDRVKSAGLKNVRVIQGDAMNTGFQTESMDTILLFGVIPAPFLPLNQLLPEIHRVLKHGGILAVWPPIPVFLPGSILSSGLFISVGKRNGVWNFRRIT
jgi:demethylmenaquinone methyltransferase/2-methoxy-6-polyprenyl-1,4-benzoquinol methylase